MNTSVTGRFPTDLADRCVKCGLCLPQCPTYLLARDEGDSPRGRIALMQGLASNELTASTALLGHLDRCLVCRSCERVCPAQVPYGRLIDAAREVLNDSGARDAAAGRISAWVLSRPRIARMLTALLMLARRLGLLRVMARHAPLRARRLAQRIPYGAKMWHPVKPPTSPSSADAVSLFTACLPPLIDATTLEDAIAVLRAMGVEVVCRQEQTCCGAMDLHAGRRRKACKLARANLEAFAGDQLPVLGLVSGCTATLSEYDTLVAGGTDLSRRVQDAIAWIGSHSERLPALALPEPLECVVHYPCTHRNVLGNHDCLGPLLDKVRNLRWRNLNPPSNCCGAAGTYMLTQPESADALAATHVSGLGAHSAEILLTSNIGCAMHLQAAMAKRPDQVRVLHPVSILARALPDASYNAAHD